MEGGSERESSGEICGLCVKVSAGMWLGRRVYGVVRGGHHSVSVRARGCGSSDRVRILQKPIVDSAKDHCGFHKRRDHCGFRTSWAQSDRTALGSVVGHALGSLRSDQWLSTVMFVGCLPAPDNPHPCLAPLSRTLRYEVLLSAGVSSGGHAADRNLRIKSRVCMSQRLGEMPSIL